MNLMVDLDHFQTSRDYLSRCENIIGNVRSTVVAQKNAMSSRALRSSGASYQIPEVCERLQRNKESIRKLRNTLGSIYDEYRSMENGCKELSRNVSIGAAAAVGGAVAGWSTSGSSSSPDGSTNTVLSDALERVLDIIGGGGAIGSALATVGALLTGGVSVKDARFIPGIVENIAGGFKDGSSFDWKKLVGLDEWEMPKWDDYKFGKGKGVSHNVGVAAKWAGSALSAIINGVDNFTGDREGENNSNGRALAETIGETVVDIGADMLIGIGVAGAISVLAAPGAAVGAVVVGGTVLVKWALDSAFENLWGKDFSETVSDAVLDTAEFVGNAAKNAVKAVGNAAKAVGDAISGWWKKAFA